MVQNLSSSYMDALNRSVELTHKNASGFIQCVEELARKAGVANPRVHYVPSALPNASFSYLNSGEYCLGFSDGLFHLLGNTNLHAAPNGEMQAVIGHELSHTRYRFQEAGTKAFLLTSLPLSGAGVMYLIDKTNEKLKERKQLHPDKPQEFWDAFHETMQEVGNAGVTATMSDFFRHAFPLFNKLATPDTKDTHQMLAHLHGVPPAASDPAASMTWGEAVIQQAKYLAITAAMAVPALAAARHMSIAHEYRADRFAVALTGNKDMASALKKLTSYTTENIAHKASNALEKSWAERIGNAIRTFIREATEGAHPPTSSRIAALEKINIADATKSFGL